ncbi:metal-dependent hydrolase [Ramlibacter pallidus]|uniref:Metal-dependent hydrolase n=1 Tax=Ramlibacter pallidus TaxID=2780087 RepID=A0ABR9S837_9BURK|nr:metal-dependent hydrolase [Ramlibacter pallidus]
MDSLSQIALGAAVGVAVMGRRTAAWKAVLWGGIAGTLPDLDVFIDHGDALRNMTMHRGFSHALFWLTLASPVLAAAPAALHRQREHFARWWLAIWLALVTHPLLDAMTVYGTQLLLPFTDHPFGVGSVFIIDPLYTLPLLAGLAVVLARRDARGLRWNHAGLLLSTAYLAWSVGAQWHVRGVAQQALAATGARDVPLLVTPTPFNTVLWRVVAMHPDGSYDEGFYSLLDGGRPLRLRRFEGTVPERAGLARLEPVQRLARFTHGFYTVHVRRNHAWVTDLRMGQEPHYAFAFVVARADGARWVPLVPRNQGSRGDVRAALGWLWQRLQGEDVPPPGWSAAEAGVQRLPSAVTDVTDRVSPSSSTSR